jgi:hypothetical protein
MAPKLNLWPFPLGKKESSMYHIEVDGELIPSADAVRDLGAWFDKHMNMSIHVKKICQTCQSAFANLHSICRIRRYLDVDSTKKLVHALVISRLDYNNVLLFGLHKKTSPIAKGGKCCCQGYFKDTQA